VPADATAGSGERWPSSQLDPFVEEPIDVRRYVEVLRRNRRLIAGIVVGVTLVAFGVSLLLPASYSATARILIDNSADPSAPTDAASVVRQLATAQRLVMTPRILARAAERVPGESENSLEKKVVAKADTDANIVNVSASDRDRDGAAAIANAVATAFIDDQRNVASNDLKRARKVILARLASLGSSPNDDAQRNALAARLSDLELRAATADDRFRLAEPAERPDQQASPHPLRTALLALIASIGIAVLVAFGRDQLRPQITGPRELSRATDLPILAWIPDSHLATRDREARTRILEDEAYRALRGRVILQLPPSPQHVILVTSGAYGQGKSAVSAGLARALAETNHATLLVSADLARPAIDDRFDVAQEPGFADILLGANFRSHGRPPVRRDPRTGRFESHASIAERIRAASRPVAGHGHAELAILASGTQPSDPARVLTNDAVGTFGNALRQLDFAYVVIDAPPLLATNDSLILGSVTDQIVVVAHLDGLTRPTALDVREVLDEIARPVLGLVVIGARVAVTEDGQLREPSRGVPRRSWPRRLLKEGSPRDRTAKPAGGGSAKSTVPLARRSSGSDSIPSDGHKSDAREGSEAGDRQIQ
jgi:succinoglycan biosynthesis transport protein ExoP